MHVARGCSRQARAGADCVAALHGSSTMMWRLCRHVHAHVAAAVTPVRCLALSKHSKAAGAPQSACHAVCHCHGRQLPAAGAPKQSVSGCVSWVLRLGPAPATKATRPSVHFGTVNSRTLGPDLLHHACVASCPCVCSHDSELQRSKVQHAQLTGTTILQHLRLRPSSKPAHGGGGI